MKKVIDVRGKKLKVESEHERTLCPSDGCVEESWFAVVDGRMAIMHSGTHCLSFGHDSYRLKEFVTWRRQRMAN